MNEIIFNALEHAASKADPRSHGIIHYNDMHSHAEVMAVWQTGHDYLEDMQQYV